VVGKGFEQGIGIVGAGDDLVSMRLENGFDPRNDDRVIVGDDHGARHGRARGMAWQGAMVASERPEIYGRKAQSRPEALATGRLHS